MKDIYILVSRVNADWEKAAAKFAGRANIIFLTRKELAEKESPAEYLISTGMSEEELSRLPNLKKVWMPKTGTDGFPVALMNERGICLVSSHANAIFVAEHAVTLAFSLLRNITVMNQKIRNDEDPKPYNAIRSMKNMNIGIMGFGNIGRYIAAMLKPFDVNVAIYNQAVCEGVKNCSTVKELFECSDIAFSCLPLTDETRDMIGYEELSLLRGKYLVNVSRAEVIKEEDLYRVLEEGILKGYAADVWFDEKWRYGDHYYDKFDNVIITPHCAANVADGRLRYMEDALSKCVEELERN